MIPDALQRRFPSLDLPRVELGTFPTPVERVDELGRPGRVTLRVKREDRASPLYGGNKVRKLEYLLAGLPPSVRHVLSVGGTGSHHLLATALFGARLGLSLHAVVVEQPDTPEVRRNYEALRRHAASLWPVARQRDVPLGLLKAWRYARTRGDGRPLLVPPGGSSLRGTVGWVAGGLEIAEQVREGVLPPPSELYVALGSMGTAAGLLVGLRLGGLSTRVVGVRVADLPFTTGRATLVLARRVLRFLQAHGARLPSSLELTGFRAEHRFAGPGYGAWTPAASEAARLARERAGLPLELTYTGKTLAACLHDLRQRRTGPEVLFLQTAPAGPPPEEASGGTAP